MRLKEQRLWDSFKSNAPKDWWLQRVENVVLEGMPDVYVTLPGDRTCWIELKAPIRPKRNSTRLLGTDGLRPSQINWHLKAATKAKPTYILVRDDQLALYLIPGELAKEANDLTLSQLEDHAIDDWHHLINVLENDI